MLFRYQEEVNEKMKNKILKFIQRGFIGATFGPLVLALIYWILGLTNTIDSLPVNEVVLGIISISVLAFIAAGIPIVYELENLPLATAILIHCFTLYIDYAIIYLLNGWLAKELIPFLVFSAIFLFGFALVWCIIYLCERKNIKKLNQKINQ
jgi:hypothetical protein